jgi:putative selenium metabolism protein SsnA
MATTKKSKDKESPAPRTLALTNALVADGHPARVRSATLVLEGALITGVVDAPPAGAEVIDCGGRLVTPGQVCAHTHLYSSLARGMPPPPRDDAPLNFVQILERVWWKLDRALDAASLEASALVGALEALKSGTTTLVDHHASPAFIDGSLDVVAGALERVGARGVLCYEVTDRGGINETRAGVRENDRFLSSLKDRPLLRGMVGAHAAFTLSNGSAEAIVEVAQRHDVGVHIHLAEDSVDAKRDGWPTLDWLRQRGLVGPRSLFAHAVHVTDAEARRIVEAAAHVVHNPRSNLNNRVGYARPSRFGARLLLGTDGIGADMRAEAHAAFLAARDHGDALDVAAALERNRELAAFLFGSGLGRIEPGAPADLVVYDYRAPTPLDGSNFAGHLLFGLPGAPVRHVFCDGELVVKDGVSTRVDEEALYARAREEAARLWKRMA